MVEGSLVAAVEGLAEVDAAESAVAAELEEVVADVVAGVVVGAGAGAVAVDYCHS